MSDSLNQLQPTAVWQNFIQLNAIPRASKKEGNVVEFMRKFGEQLGLKTSVDDVGNVIIQKPASKGMEQSNTVVLQGHLDMVHQKNADTNFDFEKQGIEMYVDGDWVKAKGTTLGADNGMGVAAIMTILASKEIAHPALEALFTIDEETGMTGALQLKPGSLSGKFLLNLDTENDDELTIGCAGGIDVTASGNYVLKNAKYTSIYSLQIKGLTGGHSGIDIHLGRANANKLMNRMVYKLAKKFPLEIHSLEGGSLRNAIPRESKLIFGISRSSIKVCREEIKYLIKALKEEYLFTDPNLQILFDKTESPSMVMPFKSIVPILNALYACPNGIYRMSPDVKDLVQSSNNLARVQIKDGAYNFQCLTRSSVESEKEDLKDAITACFEQIGASVQYGGAYPGWTPKPDSDIVCLLRNTYRDLFNSEAHVNACHAGLECGIIGTHYPNMQMISFGPTILGAHSPDEKVNIASVQKFWNYLLEILKRIPKK